ncbi:DUF6542 domain-containing protein [Streptomyces sp. NBC_01304]|uniref:DUF6542 domain-containing protein n=1 Tax=Streptomyces sp. NBC_01304 TaxID=2903818 RepID=UPI002E157ACD|nr:hypothetical protein OG430_18865 [Streptomyces sp. NBC_01304]
MEQHRTRPPQPRSRRPAPLPPQAGGAGDRTGSGTVYRAASRSGRPVPPVALTLRRGLLAARRAVEAVRAMPNPRLTGLGSGLFAAAAMLVLASLDRLLLDGSMVAFGLLFLPVSALTAFWVRPADLVTAPVGVPIAFAVGLLPIAGGSDGFGGHVMGLVTALAIHAGWLYGGTLVAGLIVTVRKVKLMARKRAARDAARGARPPHRRVPAA